MALKHGSTTLTVLKHGSTTLTSGYHGSTKVFSSSGITYTPKTSTVSGTTGSVIDKNTMMYYATLSITDTNISTDSSHYPTVTVITGEDASMYSVSSSQIRVRVYASGPRSSVSARVNYYVES